MALVRLATGVRDVGATDADGGGYRGSDGVAADDNGGIDDVDVDDGCGHDGVVSVSVSVIHDCVAVIVVGCGY